MKKVILIMMLAFSANCLRAQIYSDPISLFKMMLFLDKKNVSFEGMDSTVTKGDSLLWSFNNFYTFKLDTLKPSINKISTTFVEDFEFYRLNVDSLKGSRTLQKNEVQYLGIFTSTCVDYIIAINVKTGTCYRLKGFNSNDFLSFLTDFKNSYKENRYKKLSNSEFLKNYKVKGLDFECLYKGLKSTDFDSDKYPCLKRCSDPFVAHSRY